MRSSGRSAASSYRTWHRKNCRSTLAAEPVPGRQAEPAAARSSDDQLLGFGAAEALTMLTPVILTFTSTFWQALVAEAAESSAHGVLAYVRSHLPGHHEAAAPPLTRSSSSWSGRWLNVRPAGWTYPKARPGSSPMRWSGS